MLIDIYLKFGEDIVKVFQVTERTRFSDGLNYKGNNYKRYMQELYRQYS